MRRRILASVGGKPLPYKRPLSYISCTGTQYIDTGIKMMNDLEFESKINIETVVYNQFFIGAYFPNNRRFYIVYISGGRLGFGYGSGNSGGTSTLNMNEDVIIKTILKNGDQRGYVNGLLSYSKTLEEDVGLDLTIKLGKSKAVGDEEFVSGKFFFAKINQNGREMNLIPVMSLNDEPCMYDLATGRGGMNHDGTPRDDGLYFNRGTGTFGYEEL